MVKESKEDVILKNGAAGLLARMIVMIMQYLIQVATLWYIGVEVVGIRASITSVLSTLSLTELGFQSAVTFYLYEPLNAQDYNKINRILEILKWIYRFIGCFLIILSLMILPFLKYILKGIDINGAVVGYFLLLSFNSAFTYFIGYKRVLLFADRREYISKSVDCLFSIATGILALVTIMAFRNYMLVLVLKMMETIGSNIAIQRLCKKKYPFLGKVGFDKSLFHLMVKDVNNIFFGKLAGYVYGSTDNLLISFFIGAVYVGYLSNYKMFFSALASVVNSLFTAMTPIIGNMLINTEHKNKREADFRCYSYIRYLIASLTVVPMVFLGNDLVSLFFGKRFVLSQWIVILLAGDLYISVVYNACCEYLYAGGEFRADRNIAIAGALINLGVSVICLYRWGMAGVLLGTLISQIFFWIGRGAVVYFNVFKMNMKAFRKYILKNLLWLSAMAVTMALTGYIRQWFMTDNLFVSILITFALCEILNILVQFVLLHFTEEQIRLVEIVKSRYKLRQR